MDNTDKILALRKRIRRTLLKERAFYFGAGLMGTAAVIIIASIVLSLLAGIMVVPVGLKIAVLGIAATAALYTFWRLAFSRLFTGSEEATAVKLEKKYSQLKGRLIAAIQFARMKKESDPGFSVGLVGATLEQAARESTGLNFDRVVSAYPVWKNLQRFGAAAVLAVLMLLIFPGFFSFSYEVYSNPTEVIMPPLGYNLDNYPGSSVAIKYRDVDLGGILTGDKFPDEATVYYRFAEGNWQKTEIDLRNHKRTTGSFGDSLLFYTTLKQVRRSLDYYVKAGKMTTEVAHVDVVDRPRVNGIELSIFYPEYTGLEPTTINENDGSIAAVIGSRVNMNIETNVPVQRAEMVFSDSSRSPFEINGKTGEQAFRIEKDRAYTIHLLDNQGESNPDPIEYYITAVPDEYPVIEVIRPGRDVNLNEEMIVPLQLRISDDYGFSSLVLKYSIVTAQGASDEKVAVLHFSDRIKTEGEIEFNWDVEPLGLMPSEYISYYFELADNDRISGPKITTSRKYIARLPSLEEIIAQTEAEYNENIDRSEQFLRQQRELSERLKNIARKIEQQKGNGDQKLPWQHKKELEEITKKDAEIAEQLEETAKNIDEMIDKMQENRLSTREMLEKIQEVQKLFEEVATPEMREARLKLMEALKQMNQKEIEDALEDFQMTQEELMNRLERTIALLKKMKIEQKVTSMAQMANELAEKQNDVNKDTEGSETDRLPGLAKSEQEVQKQLQSLKKEAQKLREMLKEIPYDKAPEADKFCKAVENTTAEENMEKMTQELKEQDREEALKEGRESYSKLLEMSNQLQEGQANMCQGGGNEAAQKMREAIEDINYISNEQERSIGDVSSTIHNSEVLRDLAAEQQLLKDMTRALSIRIEEIGRQTPFMAAELSNLVKSAMQNMDLSVDKMVDKRGRDAVNYQREALYNLNRASVRMLDALESQKNCNKGGSCNKPSQKLEALAKQQQMLNQKTQAQCNNPKPGQNGEAMAVQQAARQLAGEQSAIHKSLEELMKEFGSSREVLGRLDAIADDMDKVVDMLSEGEVGEQLRDRQLKIYSRMLDATRTMQRKDFTEQRKAQMGEDILRSSPAALSADQLQGGVDVDDRLRKFMSEDYPEEYEQHIKAYFKALMESMEYQKQPANENK